MVNRRNYTNANAVGYVDGQIYAGPYHMMSDGTMMTGDEHTPLSKRILSTPTDQIVPQLKNESIYSQTTTNTQSYVSQTPTQAPTQTYSPGGY